jgi:5'-nucleotidase
MVHVDEDTWSCGGTPADCVVIAVLGGMPELAAAEKLTETNYRNTSSLDLVISGINRGSNTGTDIVFSGTAAGARQGAFYNIPSLALSLAKGDGPSRDEWHWDMAVDFTVMRLNEMMAYWKPGSFVNVNIPNKKDVPTALVHAFPSLRYYDDYVDTYKVSDKIRYCFVKLGDYEKKPERGSDREVIAENKVSVSVICIHPVLLESVKGEGVI